MTQRILESEADRDLWLKFISAQKLPMTVSMTKGRDRSLEQNSLQFLWANEASQQRGDMTTEEVRCEWKLVFGVPILRAENEEFREIYDAAIKPLTYEMKLKLMRTYPVTSEMTVKQMTAYLDTIQRECAEQGIRLTDPAPKEKAA